ncbi:hypothetical protein ABC304_12785 [Microbacterium sp. 1P10UB]|uniref:DUF6993 domain-containing protein n=1 Tax=unclassified Microbacterium TaxID=2609290 RepID=UPI0039A0AE56
MLRRTRVPDPRRGTEVPPMRVKARVRRSTSPLLIGTVVAVIVTGCTAGPSDPSPTASAPSGAGGSPSPTAAAPATTDPTAPPGLVPTGSAVDNLPLFTSVVGAVWADGAPVTGRTYIDALTAAGFDKAAMQVTQDSTTIGNPAEAIQFAVRWGDECLTGQVGPTTPNPVTAVLPGLPSGGCLLGETRAIDW